MDRMWNFAKRHRGKLIVAGVVSAVSAGGLYLVHKLAESKYREWKEKEAKDMMEKVRQQHHFESTWRTGNLTLKGALLPALFEALANALDTEDLVAQIKECQILSDKVEMWQKLKEMAFGRCLSLVICSTYLEILLRCQLSILAGYTYRETVSKKVSNDQNENHRQSDHHLSSRVQEKYLSLSQIFIETGIPSLCQNLVENAVKNVIGNVPLNENVTLSNFEMYLNTMVTMCQNQCNKEIRCLLQSGPFESVKFDESEKEMLDVLLGETFEVLECDELTSHATQATFGHMLNSIVDKIAEKIPNNEVEDSTVDFVHPGSMSMPMAKLIPILCGILPTNKDQQLEKIWTNRATSSEAIKTFSSNIYQSFSTPVASYQ